MWHSTMKKKQHTNEIFRGSPPERRSMKSIHPTPGHILIQKVEPEKKTKSGILLSDTQETPSIGIVLQTGTDTVKDGRTLTSPVKKDDHIIYKKWGGQEITLDGQEYQLISFEDVLAIVQE